MNPVNKITDNVIVTSFGADNENYNTGMFKQVVSERFGNYFRKIES